MHLHGVLFLVPIIITLDTVDMQGVPLTVPPNPLGFTNVLALAFAHPVQPVLVNQVRLVILHQRPVIWTSFDGEVRSLSRILLYKGVYLGLWTYELHVSPKPHRLMRLHGGKGPTPQPSQ